MRYLTMKAALALLAGLALISAPGQAFAADQEWGSVRGQVIYGGKTVPSPMKLNVTKNKTHCLAKGPLLDQSWVINKKNKGVQFALVWLAPDGIGKLPISPKLKVAKGGVVIDQPRCQFVPHVSAMRGGQNLVVKNSSPIAHNLNPTANPAQNPDMPNVQIPAGGAHTYKAVNAQKLPIKITCGAHPWMNGWVAVFAHPYFAVTDADGKFEIKDAPAGKYRLIVWQESVGYLGGSAGAKGKLITIKASGTDVGKLTIEPE